MAHLGCGGIYSESFIANCLLILTVKKKFENRLIFGEVMKYTKNGAIFWPTLYSSSCSTVGPTDLYGHPKSITFISFERAQPMPYLSPFLRHGRFLI